MELLILADDLTGALDTGIQFVAAGASTRVVLDPHYDLRQVDPDVQVLVVDTESRHIAQEDAADL
ncbi:four-carbon acid sugar kinase family protein, partial [Acidaminococcus massiliensis]